MNVRATATAVAWSWLAATATTAAAQQSPPPPDGQVRLEVTECPRVPADGVRRVLSVEIGDLLIETGGTGASQPDTLSIRCAGNLAFVEASGGGEPPIERIFPLDDFPGEAAPRALALLGVELLAARSAAVRERIMGRQSGRAAALPPVATATSRAPSAAPALAERDVRVGVAGLARTFGVAAGASAIGGRLEASATAMRLALIGGDLEFATQQKDVVTVGRTSAWLLSAAATVGMFAARGRWRAALGLGGRLGLVRESGAGADPARVASSTFVRPWGGPMVSAQLAGTVGRVALTVGGEAGWSLSAIDEMAAGGTVISVGGPWLALSIGADLRVR